MTDKEVIKQALQALEINIKLTKAFLTRNGMDFTDDLPTYEELAAKLRAALAENDSEPVAELKIFVNEDGPILSFTPKFYGHLENGIYQLYTSPQPQPLTSAPDSYVPCCADQTCPKCVAAKPQPLPVPQGWKLVPVEPTEEMIEAGINTPVTDTGDDSVDRPEDYKAVYSAMLAAAPEAPAVQTVSIQRFMRVEEELAAMTDEFMRVAAELATFKQSVSPAVQPLTDEWFRNTMLELYGIELKEGDYADDILLVRAVEAAHGIGAPEAPAQEAK